MHIRFVVVDNKSNRYSKTISLVLIVRNRHDLTATLTVILLVIFHNNLLLYINQTLKKYIPNDINDL